MKYIFLILLGLLVLASATYAEGNGKAGQMSMTQAGNITVKGKIVDEEGEPLPGATVQQKGTSNGSITDMNGNFSLSVPSDATLIVSFIGFKSIEVPLAEKLISAHITLVSESKELDQVVVIGYGTQRKVDLTGSVAVVNHRRDEEGITLKHLNHARRESSRRSNYNRRTTGSRPYGTYSWYRFVRQHRTALRY
jgi:hypothetical protein